MNWLSMDGAFAALIIGTLTLGLGGISAAVALLLFFSSSYFISFMLGHDEADEYRKKDRRDGRQVWANAFWFVLFITLGFYYRDDMMRIAAAGSLAAAMSDTWATEMGTRSSKVKTYFILNFKRVPSGTDGGVSLMGTLAGLLGGFFLSIVYVLISGYHTLTVFGIIGLAGFLGCILDSYLGAIFQTQNKELKLPVIFSGPDKLDNNSVNAVSTGFGAFITLCLLWLI